MVVHFDQSSGACTLHLVLQVTAVAWGTCGEMNATCCGWAQQPCGAHATTEHVHMHTCTRCPGYLCWDDSDAVCRRAQQTRLNQKSRTHLPMHTCFCARAALGTCAGTTVTWWAGGPRGR